MVTGNIHFLSHNIEVHWRGSCLQTSLGVHGSRWKNCFGSQSQDQSTIITPDHRLLCKKISKTVYMV